MSRLRGLVAVALAWLAPCAGWAQDVFPFACAKTDAACVRRTLHAHPVHRLATWEAELARPLVERIEPAPASVVHYLNLENAANGYPQRARAAQPSPAFIAEVKAALGDLPAEVNLLFVDKLAGIVLVDDLGGTGFTDVVEDAAGHPIGGYIVLDAGVLASRGANDWATWRESTPFAPEPGWQLDARIESRSQDSRRNAIQYILLHELGHLLSIGNALHPPWTVEPKDAGPTDAYPFFSLSWQVDAARNRYESHFDAAFPLRDSVAYYFGPKLRASQMAEAYNQLSRTNFPSLYAATRPGDDFAESFASYVHVVMMKRPWEVTIRRGDEEVLRFPACWDEPRCADKRRMLAALLGKGPP